MQWLKMSNAGTFEIQLKVQLNGTTVNPYRALGLTQNPFPQIPVAGIDTRCIHLQALGGEPIPDTDYIRRHLKGWSQEFVDLCCRMYVPGKYITFTTTFGNFAD